MKWLDKKNRSWKKIISEEQVLYAHCIEEGIEKIEKIEVKCNNCGECCKKASPIGSPCMYLTVDNLCSVYERRLSMCRSYPVHADSSFGLCEPYNVARNYFYEKYNKNGVIAILDTDPQKHWK